MSENVEAREDQSYADQAANPENAGQSQHEHIPVSKYVSLNIELPRDQPSHQVTTGPTELCPEQKEGLSHTIQRIPTLAALARREINPSLQEVNYTTQNNDLDSNFQQLQNNEKLFSPTAQQDTKHNQELEEDRTLVITHTKCDFENDSTHLSTQPDTNKGVNDQGRNDSKFSMPSMGQDMNPKKRKNKSQSKAFEDHNPETIQSVPGEVPQKPQGGKKLKGRKARFKKIKWKRIPRLKKRETRKVNKSVATAGSDEQCDHKNTQLALSKELERSQQLSNSSEPLSAGNSLETNSVDLDTKDKKEKMDAKDEPLSAATNPGNNLETKTDTKEKFHTKDDNAPISGVKNSSNSERDNNMVYKTVSILGFCDNLYFHFMQCSALIAGDNARGILKDEQINLPYGFRLCNKNAVIVTFNIIVPGLYWSWNSDKGSVFLRFGRPEFGNWSNVGRFQAYR